MVRLSAGVGEPAVFQQTPRWVTALPPTLTTSPPPWAPLARIPDGVLVVTVAGVGAQVQVIEEAVEPATSARTSAPVVRALPLAGTLPVPVQPVGWWVAEASTTEPVTVAPQA